MGARGPSDADHPSASPDSGLAAAPRWGIPDAAIGFVAGLVGATITGSVWIGLTGSRSLTLGAIVSGLVGLWAGYVGVCWWVSRSKGSSSFADDFGLRLERRGGDVRSGAVAGFLSSVVLVRVVYVVLVALGLVSQRSLDRLGDPAERLQSAATGGWRFVVLAIFIGIGAPVVEELYFRGLLQRSLVRRLGPVPGILLSALVFGLAHGEPLQLPALAAFGVVLGWLAWRTGRLGPGIVAHVVFNGITLVALASTSAR